MISSNFYSPLCRGLSFDPLAETTRPPAFDLGPIAFDERLITRYLTLEQRERINRQEVDPVELERYIALIDSPDGMQTISQDIENFEKYPILALRALINERMTPEQFATQCMLYSTIDQMIVHPSRYEIRLNRETMKFDYYKINIDPAHFPRLAMKTHFIDQLDAHEKDYLKNFLHSTKEGVEVIINLLKNAPSSERCFFSVELPVGPIANWSPLYQAINRASNFFGPVNEFGVSFSGSLDPLQPQFLIVPSYSILKTFLKYAFPDSSMDLQPALGKFTTRTISEHKIEKGTRLINMGMPGADVPEQADDFEGGKIIFIIHDFFHALRDCICPDPFHKAVQRIVHIADQILSNPTISDKSKIRVRKVRWEIIDGGKIFSMNNSQIRNFGSIFSDVAFPEKYLEFIKRDIDENNSMWFGDFRVTSGDYSDLEIALLKKTVD